MKGIRFLDKDFQTLSYVDEYLSYIYTDKYVGAGDSELALPYSQHNIWLADLANMIIFNDQPYIIQTVEETDIKEPLIVIKGMGLEDILNRRIFLKDSIYEGTASDIIKMMLDDNIVKPTDPDRKIQNFSMINNVNDSTLLIKTEVDALTPLNEAIDNICLSTGIGYDVKYVNGEYIFILRNGVDRSHRQIELPFVEFSKSFDNIVSTQKLSSNQKFKNVCVCRHKERELVELYVYGSAKGLTRRETGVEVRSEEVSLQKATEIFEKNKKIRTYDAEVDSNITYKYGEDFEIGDIVQFQSYPARVVSITMAHDDTGVYSYPTFEII